MDTNYTQILPPPSTTPHSTLSTTHIIVTVPNSGRLIQSPFSTLFQPPCCSLLSVYGIWLLQGGLLQYGVSLQPHHQLRGGAGGHSPVGSYTSRPHPLCNRQPEWEQLVWVSHCYVWPPASNPRLYGDHQTSSCRPWNIRRPWRGFW